MSSTTKQKRHRDTLRGLDGVSRDETEAVRVHSVTDAVAWIRKADAVTTAGDNGALSVWRDDAGWFRCEFDRYRVPVNQMKTATVTGVKSWLTKWWPKLGR